MIIEIGKHKVKHGDVMNGIDDLMQDELADIFYTDLPWKGTLSYWHSIRARMDGGSKAAAAQTDIFLSQIFNIANKYTKNCIMIEYGVKGNDELFSIANNLGIRHESTIITQYKSGSKMLPAHLHVFSKHGLEIPSRFKESVTGTFGYPTTKKACSFFIKRDGVILDPCCGMGYSAQVAVDNGMVFRGNELTKSRLDKTIKRLS